MKSSTTNIVTVPSFTEGAHVITLGQIALDEHGVSLTALREATFAQFIDACTVAGVPRNEKGCKAVQAEIKTAFEEDVLNYLFERTTINNYSQGAMRAFYHDKPWTARSFQAVDKGGIEALPWSNRATVGKGKGKGKTAGSVSETNRVELDKTICKLLAQSRLLGLHEFAADILDIVIESLDGFNEVVAE